MRILVVDPNEAFATLLSEELKRQGYDVVMCLAGNEALESAHGGAVDLAILDMALSDPDALTLGEALRAVQAEMRMMVIPLMGETLPTQATELGIQGVLPKPFFLPDLPGLIGTALGDAPSAEEDTFSASSQSAVSDLPVQSVAPPPRVASRRQRRSGETPTTSRTRTAGASRMRERFEANCDGIEQLMSDLLRDVGADAALLTVDDELVAWVGGLEKTDVEPIAQAVVHGWQTSAEVARILGRRQTRFEQSITGGDYVLYALSVESTVLLAVVVRGSAALGLLRHSARTIAEQISRRCLA